MAGQIKLAFRRSRSSKDAGIKTMIAIVGAVGVLHPGGETGASIIEEYTPDSAQQVHHPYRRHSFTYI